VQGADDEISLLVAGGGRDGKNVEVLWVFVNGKLPRVARLLKRASLGGSGTNVNQLMLISFGHLETILASVSGASPASFTAVAEAGAYCALLDAPG
jgi:hypothetical protein